MGAISLLYLHSSHCPPAYMAESGIWLPSMADLSSLCSGVQPSRCPHKRMTSICGMLDSLELQCSPTMCL